MPIRHVKKTNYSTHTTQPPPHPPPPPPSWQWASKSNTKSQTYTGHSVLPTLNTSWVQHVLCVKYSHLSYNLVSISQNLKTFLSVVLWLWLVKMQNTTKLSLSGYHVLLIQSQKLLFRIVKDPVKSNCFGFPAQNRSDSCHRQLIEKRH